MDHPILSKAVNVLVYRKAEHFSGLIELKNAPAVMAGLCPGHPDGSGSHLPNRDPRHKSR
ncbi:hypothetical protein CHELA40_50649 [Chelatococcus asaccharovorans]|nr:hypothetical protein CHELA17_20617 [Chelatococcus asaccharovorans]CAH1693731.1 hypothetical protein CHELA40_50649 [Chelatococcus asaccharovorans]